ncbi:MAG TPA: carbohydrate ABC transporter permease [Pseudomonadales bacterium]|nr:carbohydrate ABC transporter permease [Pseudomonadales bacterium]
MRGRPRPALRDAAVLLGLALYALPFFWQVLTSLKPEAELMLLPPLLPSRLTWEHYQVVLERSLMLRALVNSLGVGLLTTVLALILGLAAAYGFARFPVPGKGPLLLAIVAGTAFPQIATVSPLYLLMRALGLRDTWLGLILANTSFALPLVVWLLAGFIRDLPVALEEAAAVDGAGRLQAFRWVVLPLVAPGLASAALLTFLLSWNEFLFAYTFTATEASRTAPVALALFPGVFEVPWGDIAAASILASLPPIAVVVGLQRYLVRGLVAGALRE